MCGGGGGGGEDPVAYQREQEQKRQADIERGKKQLDQIFAGLEGKRVVTEEVPYDTTTGKNIPGTQTVERVVDDPTKDPLWDQQREAYVDYAMPQVEDEYGDASGELTYALARQGQSQSSLAGDRRSKLRRDYNLRQQEVADKGRGYANQAKQNIADQKQSMLQMLTTTADPGAAATAARSAVSAMRDTPSFSPIGPLFQSATQGMAAGLAGNSQYQQKKRFDNAAYYSRDPDRGSGNVVR